MADDITRDSVQLARLEERLTHLGTDFGDLRDEVRKDMTEMRHMIEELSVQIATAKGGWRMLLAVGGAVAAVVEGVHQLAGFIKS